MNRPKESGGASIRKRTAIRESLVSWFDVHKRDLPWRRSRDPYGIWVSEVMLQQTQVPTVVDYWKRFVERFPTLELLARAPLSDVLSLWRGLGYYARARNLHRASKQVLEQFGGQLPSDPKQLAELPGFGRYTTGAVASIAFGHPEPLVDGNAARVLSRLFAIRGFPGDLKREARLWEAAAELVIGERPGDFNQALMELGALICTPQDPSCLLCPARTSCRAVKLGIVSQLPPPRVRARRKHLRFAVAVCERDGELLLGMRQEKGLFGGLWELPSAELIGGVNTPQVQAALRGAFGANIQLGEPLGSVRRTLTHRDLELDLYRVAARSTPSPGPRYQEFRWVSIPEARHLGMSTAMQRALELVGRPPGKPG
jgi:A/G-specific adenine glycosylase